MKRLLSLCLLIFLAVTPLASLAEVKLTFTEDDYVSLGELREQALEGWHQTYNPLGREIVANAYINWMPDTNICPIIQIEGWGKKQIPKDALKTYQGIKGVKVHEFDCSLSIDYYTVSDLAPNQKQSKNYDASMYTQPRKTYYDGEIPAEKPENLELSYDELLAKIEAEIKPLCGLTWKDFHIKAVNVTGVEYKGFKNKQGELVRGEAITKSGWYALEAQQIFHGIPELGGYGCSGEWTATPKGALEYAYFCPGRYSLTLSCSKEVGIHTPDVPLLSFDAMKRAIEVQMNAGYLHCVDEMEFGYMAFYQGDRNSNDWLLMPVWRILGTYNRDKTIEHVVPYVDEVDGGYNRPWGYYHYFFSAQTGELLPTASMLQNGKLDNPIEARDVVTWDDVKKSQQ